MRSMAIALLLAAPVSAQQSVVDCARPASPSSTNSPQSIPFELTNNHIYLKVCARGRALDFILDTGAPNSFFDLGTAKELGIRLGAKFQAVGAGSGTAEGARLDRTITTLAHSGLEHPIALSIDFSEIRPREGRRIEGVLGYDFINRFVIEIDYLDRELRLHDRDDFRYQGPGMSPKMVFTGNYPFVDAELTLNDGAKVRGRFLLDIGATQGVQLKTHWVEEHRLRERAAPTIRRRGGSGIGGALSYEIGRIRSLRLGGAELARPVVLLYGDSAGGFARRGTSVGDLGAELLRRFTVFIDYKRKQLILEPHAGTNEPFEADMSGLGLMMDTSLTGIVVDYVAPESPASELQLERGDMIVAVDGRSVNESSLNTLRQRFLKDGERVALTIRRGTETRVVTLVARRMV
jgi:hypothetical protein